MSTPTVSEQPPSAGTHRRPAVLLVQPEDADRSATAMMLRSGGSDVLECATAPAALDLLSRRRLGVSLLLVEVDLPVLRGPDLVRAARERSPDLPAVYVTDCDRAQLFAWGVPAHALVLVRPFTQGDLVGVVDRALWTAAVP